MNWQKRFVIGMNIGILFIFLDISLLIFVRTVNASGVYQTMEIKWLTFLIWLLCYAFVWTGQGLAFLLYKYVRERNKTLHSLQ